MRACVLGYRSVLEVCLACARPRVLSPVLDRKTEREGKKEGGKKKGREENKPICKPSVILSL